MDLAVVMNREVLADKLEDGRVQGRAVATWNTRRLPTRLTPGWTNRLFVASQGRWRGYFPLSGDVFWNPKDEAAPYALIADPRRWTPIATMPCPSFRGWRYLESLPGGAPEMAKQNSDTASAGEVFLQTLLRRTRHQALGLLPPPATSTSPPPAVTTGSPVRSST